MEDEEKPLEQLDLTKLFGRSEGKSERTESGRTEIQDQRMMARAIKQGWLGRRFDIDEKISNLKRIQKSELTLRQAAMKTAGMGCESTNARVRQGAVKNILAMEKMNQADEIQELPPRTANVAVGINVSGGAGEAGGSSPLADQSTGPRVVIYLPENGR